MTPKEECEVLLEALLSASENLLMKNGEFYPIGAVLSYDARQSIPMMSSGFPERYSRFDFLSQANGSGGRD